jgi:hypothetical protein
MTALRYLTLVLVLATPLPTLAQPEMMQWGSLRGIRLDGHLHNFETRLESVREDGSVAHRTAHYANPSRFNRQGEAQVVTVQFGEAEIEQRVQPLEAGAAQLETHVRSAPTDGSALHLTLELPAADFGAAKLEWLGATAGGPAAVTDRQGRPCALIVQARGVRVRGANRSVEVSGEQVGPILLVSEPAPGSGGIRLRFPLEASQRFTLKTEGEIDRTPVAVGIDASRPGRRFDGIGGNFRLQFPDSDPAIIDYNLEHLRVEWSRIALWWRDWHSDAATRPLEAARAGQVTDRQHAQMLMAQRLAQRDIPVMVAVWDPPAWALAHTPRRPGTFSDAVSPAQWEPMAASIADYLLYLKESYGVEAALFSFNEPDLGLVPTPEEHLGLNKALGRAFAARGLATRLLLADTSNATPKSLRYAQLAQSDPEVRGYLGGVGFHTWGGTEDENLVAWSTVARDLSLPLFVSEGGPDAEAHRHPDLFLERAYQFDEVELYLRVASLAQPTSILHWQLTADYTLLRGGGAYGHAGPLVPTLRFWAFRQLGSTPRGAFALPVRTNHPAVTAAAFHEIAKDQWAVHLLNRGAARPATISGLPRQLQEMRVIVTDGERGMVDVSTVTVVDGQATLNLAASSFTTLLADPAVAAGTTTR